MNSTPRLLRMGMVGGGPGAFIGAVHRLAAQLDGHIVLTAGAFSSQAEKSRQAGAQWRLDPSRIYGSYEEMALREAARPREERIDFVTIVTPNYLHLPVARLFLEKGIAVVSDKPATLNLFEARELAQVVEATGGFYALTHNYSGYPLVKEARALIHEGALGRVLKIVAEYPQGWLLKPLEREGHKQAAWRADPALAGMVGAMGDVGTHAEHLARYLTGLEVAEVCADFTRFVEGRALEDDANILLHYHNPYDDAWPAPRGILYASQISAGEENGPHIRIYGTEGSLEWHQPEPNTLLLRRPGQPVEIRRPGHPYNTVADAWTRLPAGHPEGFIEAFANLYREVARALWDREAGVSSGPYDLPGIRDALLGMAFIEATVASARSERKWTPVPPA